MCADNETGLASPLQKCIISEGHTEARKGAELDKYRSGVYLSWMYSAQIHAFWKQVKTG
jgi:hypothetical protein